MQSAPHSTPSAHHRSLRRALPAWKAALALCALTTFGLFQARSADPPAPPAATASNTASNEAAVAPDARAQQVLGNWLTQDRDGIIEISVAVDGTYQGRIVGGNEPARLDTTNPDPALRNERLLGHVIMQGMRYVGDGRWSTGTIRDPNNGHTYKCRMQLLAPDRLQIRGFLGVSLLGRSQVWTRYTGTSMELPPAH